MPSWKKVILSGSDASLNSLYVNGPITGSDIKINDWGSVSASLASIQNDVPTLDQVTTAGSSSTNDIFVSSSKSYYLGANSYLRREQNGGGNENIQLNGSIRLNPNTSANANNGVLIGGNGYLLAPNSSRNAQLNYGSVSGQMGIYKLNVYGADSIFQYGVDITGSLEVLGGITGSLLGTSSYALQALSASYAIEAVTVKSSDATFDYDAYVALFSSPSTDAQGLYKDVSSGLRYNPFTNRLALTGSLQVTGGITGSLFGTATSASNAATASYGASNFTTAGDVYINGNTEIYGYASVESINLIDPNSSGFSTTSASSSIVSNGNTVTLFTVGASGYEAVFLDYVVFNSTRTNKRVGNFRINFDLTANAVTYDETSTKDIGDTSGFTLFAEVVGSVMSMKAENNTGQSVQIVYERKILYVV